MPTGNRAKEVFEKCGCSAPKQVDRNTVKALAVASAQGASAKSPNRPGSGSGF